MNTNNSGRYGTLPIGLHWLMLFLLAAVYASMELRGIFPKGSALRDGMKMWHYMLGLSVFTLVWIRLAARLLTSAPAITPAPPQWQMRLSLWLHVALYLLMIVTPLLGWLLLSADGKPVPFFGLELPALIAESKDNAKQIKELHETIATAGYFLIGLHAAAALFHHYWIRDNTLRRMLPGLK
ncbi:cytochrome b [Herminiimonas sp. CN]|uniref:cytochrome b n=1 Tax=Herminiimonas sp. CN TaxID=1349818 RepID=UPI000473EFA1|nr:cytochrome b [Herminiimonas sp. CN]